MLCLNVTEFHTLYVYIYVFVYLFRKLNLWMVIFNQVLVIKTICRHIYLTQRRDPNRYWSKLTWLLGKWRGTPQSLEFLVSSRTTRDSQGDFMFRGYSQCIQSSDHKAGKWTVNWDCRISQLHICVGCDTRLYLTVSIQSWILRNVDYLFITITPRFSPE